jgi:hypothetical protein
MNKFKTHLSKPPGSVMERRTAKPRIYFQNCVKMRIRDKDITRELVIKGLCERNNVHLDHIAICSQIFTNETWFVTFKDSFDARKLYGQDAIINGRIITMI